MSNASVAPKERRHVRAAYQVVRVLAAGRGYLLHKSGWLRARDGGNAGRSVWPWKPPGIEEASGPRPDRFDLTPLYSREVWNAPPLPIRRPLLLNNSGKIRGLRMLAGVMPLPKQAMHQVAVEFLCTPGVMIRRALRSRGPWRCLSISYRPCPLAQYTIPLSTFELSFPFPVVTA